jgi:hypothetical protein
MNNQSPLSEIFRSVLFDLSGNFQHYNECRKGFISFIEPIVTMTCIGFNTDNEIREYNLIKIDLHKLKNTPYWNYVKNNMRQRYHIIDYKYLTEDVLPEIVEQYLDPIEWIVKTLVERETEDKYV